MADRKRPNRKNVVNRYDDKAIKNTKSTRSNDTSQRVIRLDDRRRDAQRTRMVRPKDEYINKRSLNTQERYTNLNTQTTRSRDGNRDARNMRPNNYRDMSRVVNQAREEHIDEYGNNQPLNARKSRKETRKVRSARSSTGVPIMFSLVFLLIVCYLVGSSYRFLTKEIIAYDTVQYGSIDAPKSTTGVVIRDEEVYRTSTRGMINYNVSDNEKVKTGVTVCSVRDAQVVNTMEENLDTINQNILKTQESRADISFYNEDVKKIDNQIKKVVDANAYNYVKGDIKKVYELKANIQKKLDVRNQMQLSENRGSLSDLASQKAKKEEELNKNITYIATNSGGIVSFYVDGMEETYTIDNIPSLQREQTTMKPEDAQGAKINVEPQDSVFKVVKSNNWYIASYVNSTYVEGWAVGDIKTIYVKDEFDAKIPLEVEVTTLNTVNKESYMVLKVTKYMLDYIDRRTIDFEVDNTQMGFKVPNSAIVEKTLLKVPTDYIEQDVVYKVYGDTVTAVSVISSGKNDEENVTYVPVQLGALNIGDTLQKPGDKNTTTMISDVINTQGIYVMNTGIAEFNKINLENSISNSTHTVLDTTNNSEINIYDRIVTDTNNIEKEQKVYN